MAGQITKSETSCRIFSGEPVRGAMIDTGVKDDAQADELGAGIRRETRRAKSAQGDVWQHALLLRLGGDHGGRPFAVAIT